MLKLNFKGKAFEITPSMVEDWHEIQTQVLIQKEREKTIKRNVSQQILNHRKVIIELLSLTDEKLIDIIQENESSIDYANTGMFKTHQPFKKK